MSKKNSSAILKNSFEDDKELSNIYLKFEKKLNHLKKKIFLVAVSGGPDSLALTALSKSYSLKNKVKFYYVLVDHNLRKNSFTEAVLVKKLLKKHKIDLRILRNKKEIKRNIQGEARSIRYDLLTKFCKKNKIKVMLTAHNLEDQVETFFIRLSRGSGLQGLSSMKQSSKIQNNITLVRPLLDLKKIQLTKISKLIFSQFFKDPTNKDSKYLRTRVRKLKKSLENIGIKYDQIFKSIKNLASSRDTLDLYFNQIYKKIAHRKKSKILINTKSLNDLNQEMKMRVIKKSITEISKSYYSPRSQKIINLIKRLEMPSKTKSTLGGCLIIKHQNHIILEKENKNKQYIKI